MAYYLYMSPYGPALAYMCYQSPAVAEGVCPVYVPQEQSQERVECSTESGNNYPSSRRSRGAKLPRRQFNSKMTVSQNRRCQPQKQLEEDVENDFSEASEDSEYLEKSDAPKPPIKKKVPKQNQNRNIVPNIIQQVFSYLSKPKKSGNMCHRLFGFYSVPQGSACTFDRFYLFHQQIKANMNHYVNVQSLSIFKQPITAQLGNFPEEEQLYYLRMTRVMVDHFLRSLSPILTAKSRRMDTDKRTAHLKARWQIRQELKFWKKPEKDQH